MNIHTKELTFVMGVVLGVKTLGIFKSVVVLSLLLAWLSVWILSMIPPFSLFLLKDSICEVMGGNRLFSCGYRSA